MMRQAGLSNWCGWRVCEGILKVSYKGSYNVNIMETWLNQSATRAIARRSRRILKEKTKLKIPIEDRPIQIVTRWILVEKLYFSLITSYQVITRALPIFYLISYLVNLTSAYHVCTFIRWRWTKTTKVVVVVILSAKARMYWCFLLMWFCRLWALVLSKCAQYQAVHLLVEHYVECSKTYAW